MKHSVNCLTHAHSQTQQRYQIFCLSLLIIVNLIDAVTWSVVVLSNVCRASVKETQNFSGRNRHLSRTGIKGRKPQQSG